MTILLETAFKEVTTLNELDQNRFAEFILDELNSERKWDHSFAETGNLLSLLAKEALIENRNGKTKNINLD